MEEITYLEYIALFPNDTALASMIYRAVYWSGHKIVKKESTLPKLDEGEYCNIIGSLKFAGSNKQDKTNIIIPPGEKKPNKPIVKIDTAGMIYKTLQEVGYKIAISNNAIDHKSMLERDREKIKKQLGITNF